MSLIFEERPSDSEYADAITWGHSLSDGTPMRPAETNWHLVLIRHQGDVRLVLVGPWTTSGMATYEANAEILWVRLKLGTFIPHLPTRKLLDTETDLPLAGNRSFWLKGAAWQFPTAENVDTFINRLAKEDILAYDPLIHDVLHGYTPDLAARTIRGRFLRVTGLSRGLVYQIQRAKQAAELLRQGTSILDTVDTLGYYDQPHLTRELKRFIGYTPAQITLSK
ncbi:MAG: helix-turn-helix transcriptional regulator [Anaerolineae bacterium]|nr:helix-turn-helix transcriptional regulator [Anaerolineae bacterium]